MNLNLAFIFVNFLLLNANVNALNCGGVDWSAFIARFPNYRCCGTNVYDPQHSICCNGKITSGNTNYACCGSYGYDTTFLCCINGLVKSGSICKDTISLTTASISSGMSLNSNRIVTCLFIFINLLKINFL